MKTIAVVILNWNGKHFLEKFLPLLFSRTFSRMSVSFAVIDNASSDGSVDYIRAHFPDVLLVHLDRNYGFTGGYNRGLKQIVADYYVLLNVDVAVSEGWLSPLVELMEEDVQVAACMPKIRSYRQPDYFEYAGAAGGFLDKYGYPFCRGRILNYIEQDTGQYEDTLDVFWTTGACMMIQAALYHQIGGFDELFFAHMEEIDLCWRLQKKGYRIKCVPQSVVFHVGGGILPNNNPYKIYLNYRNSLYMLYKNLTPGRRRKILSIRICLDILSAGVYLLSGKFSFCVSVLRACCHFLKNRRHLLQTPQDACESPAMYPHSIVWKFFIRNGKLRFREL